EYLVDEARSSKIQVRIVHGVGHQSPGRDELAGLIGDRQPVTGREINDQSFMIWVTPSIPMRSASTWCWPATSNARRRSSSLRTSRNSASRPRERAAVFVSSH